MKGSRTIGYFAVFAVMTVVPVAVEWLIYAKNPESGASVGNVAFVIYHAMTVGYAQTEIPDVEIRIAATILTTVFMIFTTLAVTKVNNMKLKQIQDQTKETSRLMNNILTTSQDMITDITSVTQQMTDLGEPVAKVHDAMQDVSTGSAETAESVQVQIQRTEQIQAHIGNVKDTAARIEQNVHDTLNKVATGTEQMAALETQVARSKSANEEVLEKMKELGTYTGQMNTITEMITSITNSTVMLALNASIEADGAKKLQDV